MGYTKEERKVTWETRKIMDLPDLPVRAYPHAACARRGNHDRDGAAHRHRQGVRGPRSRSRRSSSRRHLEEPLPDAPHSFEELRRGGWPSAEERRLWRQWVGHLRVWRPATSWSSSQRRTHRRGRHVTIVPAGEVDVLFFTRPPLLAPAACRLLAANCHLPFAVGAVIMKHSSCSPRSKGNQCLRAAVLGSGVRCKPYNLQTPER